MRLRAIIRYCSHDTVLQQLNLWVQQRGPLFIKLETCVPLIYIQTPLTIEISCFIYKLYELTNLCVDTFSMFISGP